MIFLAKKKSQTEMTKTVLTMAGSILDIEAMRTLIEALSIVEDTRLKARSTAVGVSCCTL